MENNFDKPFKKMLEDFEGEAYIPSDWNLMEEQLEAQEGLDTEMEDIHLDGMVYDSLHNLGADYNPAHWDLMLERLEDPYALRRRLVKYKVAEIALVALFIFTLVQFLPFDKIKQRTSPSKAKHSIAAVGTITDTKSKSTVLSNQDVIETPIQQKNNLNNNTSVAPSPIQSEQGRVNNNRPQNEAQALNNNVDYTSSLIVEDKVEDKKVANPPIPSAVSSANSKDQSKSTKSSTPDQPVNEAALFAEAELADTDLLNPILLKTTDQLNIPGIEEINSSTVFSDLKTPIKVRIGMALGPDANFVMTPVDQENNYQAFDQLAAGYSGGFTLGFKYNKLEIETGALYSAVTYGSRNIFEITGSFAEGGYVRQGLAGAELDLVRLPLNLKYNFFEKKKWTAYALSGVSLNMAVETFYDFTTQNEGHSDASKNFADPRAPAEYQDKFNSASNEGVFEGGSISKNTFLTANIGFGVERYFTPRMSIFLQPTYQHQFSKGLGPQGDQINSISILTGAKVTLKKRKKSRK